MSLTTDQIRNFCIIAHIDHGKSTLADRFLEITGTVEKRKMKEQLLDRMELERERGITIKLKPVRMRYCPKFLISNFQFLNKSQIPSTKSSRRSGIPQTSRDIHQGAGQINPNDQNSNAQNREYILNLIDTPGHVDFSYEVSRSLASVEGAILLVDASQGIQAQTVANLHLAQHHGLAIIPAINKIDLPNTEVDNVRESLMKLLHCTKEDIHLVSGKTGQGVEELLEAVIKKIPSPKAITNFKFQILNQVQSSKFKVKGQSSPSTSQHNASGTNIFPERNEVESKGQVFRALIFDSVFDEYRGVVAYVRVFNGTLKKGDRVHFIGTNTDAEVLGVGYLAPDYIASNELREGEIGYVITNLKEVIKCSVGDTIVSFNNRHPELDSGSRNQKQTDLSSPSFIGDPSNKNQKQKDLNSFGVSVSFLDSRFRGNDGGRSENDKKENGFDYQSLALPGYEQMKPMVFAGIFAESGEDYAKLRSALEKLKLTDASLQFEPEHSKALGFGFRCGFLGLLHLDIVRERLEREYGLDLVITMPLVGYRVYLKKQSTVNSQQGNGLKPFPTEDSYLLVKSPQDLPNPMWIDHMEEPIVRMEIVVPSQYIGKAMSVFSVYEGTYVNTTYLTETIATLEYLMPLSEILVDFYDSLKSATSGYASMNYEFFGFEKTEICKMDILVAEEPVEALSLIVYKHRAEEVGRRIVEKLKEHLPRQMFEVKIQAAIGGKIIAAERLSGMKKNVLAKMSGGDYTRKMKLLQKQKKGKKRMEALGRVKIPQEVYLEILKR